MTELLTVCPACKRQWAWKIGPPRVPVDGSVCACCAQPFPVLEPTPRIVQDTALAAFMAPGADAHGMQHSITTGTNGMGLKWASMGDWRVTAYAEGGYAVFVRHACAKGEVDWFLPLEPAPEAIERALCSALGVEYIP